MNKKQSILNPKPVGTETKVEGVLGNYATVCNWGKETAYVSCNAGITAGADGVMPVPAGCSALIAHNGTVYILGNGDVTVIGSHEPVNFIKPVVGGGLSDGVKVSNHNLLINPDFRINQRGMESYSGATQFTVDRWYTGVGVSIIPSDNGIIARCDRESTRFFQQIIVLTDEIIGVPMTFSAQIEEIHGSNISVKIGTIENQHEYLHSSLDDTGIFSFTFTPISKDIKIQPCVPSTLGEYIKLNWVKLEIGSIPTPFIPPDPATELIKCQHYYQLRSSGDINPIDLRPSMYGSPVITQRADGNYAYSADL